jgi:hypothetical protein
MDISIGSYKCRLEFAIIIVFLVVVLFGHTMCACSNFGLLEGFSNGHQMSSVAAATTGTMPDVRKNDKKEGFSNYKTNAGPQFAENNGNYTYMPSDKWSQPSLVYATGTAPSAGAQSILNRGKNQAPLASGEMDVFANTHFKPECCPNTYSNSMGCACMSTQQYNTLITRGGNNVPFSEY